MPQPRQRLACAGGASIDRAALLEAQKGISCRVDEVADADILPESSHAQVRMRAIPPPPVVTPPVGLGAEKGGVSCRHVVPAGGRVPSIK